MKSLTPDDYLIRPFKTRKGWNITHTFLSASNPPQIFIDIASKPSDNWTVFDANNEEKNTSGIFSKTLYRSIQHIFYNTGSAIDSSSVRIIPDPYDKIFYPGSDEFYVINIHQQVFGERINPNTFKITSPVSTASIYDDGFGRLISSENTSSVIGNIFYSNGIVVVGQYTGSYSGSIVTDQGMYLNTGSVVQVQFEGLHTIYEHQVICTMDPGEFNFSINPTVQNNVMSGSMSASVFVPSTGSSAISEMVSGNLTPYLTTVGLYNDQYELVATAKFPRPIKRIPTSQQTVIVKFDV